MIHHNNKSRIFIFFRNNIISIIFFTTLIGLSIGLSLNMILNEVDIIIKEQMNKRIDKIVNEYGTDYKLLCIVTNCYAIYEKHVNINSPKIGSTLKETGEMKYVNPDYNYKNYALNPEDLYSGEFYRRLQNNSKYYKYSPIITNNNLEIYSTTSLKLDSIRSMLTFKIIAGFSSLVCSVLIFIVFVRSYIKKYQDLEDKNNLREALQQKLTESVHHELSAPVSIIEANIRSSFSKLYPCKFTKSKHCELVTKGEKDFCKGCKLKNHLDDNNIESPIWNYRNIINAIENTKTVLDIMSNSKHIKHTNGSISVEQVIDNVLSSRRILSLNTLNIQVENKEGLGKYAVGGNNKCPQNFNSGKLFNVLTALINNSVEAEANLITISYKPFEANKNFLQIFVKDNGIGVRDKKNNVITNVKNFIPTYGYSTKVNEGYETYVLTLKARIFKVFNRFTNVIYSDGSEANIRGCGLALNKAILEMCGGTLDLYQNSENGAVFRIVIPIKDRESDPIEEKVLRDTNNFHKE